MRLGFRREDSELEKIIIKNKGWELRKFGKNINADI